MELASTPLPDYCVAVVSFLCTSWLRNPCSPPASPLVACRVHCILSDCKLVVCHDHTCGYNEVAVGFFNLLGVMKHLGEQNSEPLPALTAVANILVSSSLSKGFFLIYPSPITLIMLLFYSVLFSSPYSSH